MILCNICDEKTDEWYEIPCRYGSIDIKGKKRVHQGKAIQICVNCWTAIQGAVQKEREQKAILEKFMRLIVKDEVSK